MQFPALPKFLRLTPSQRAKAWEGVTPRALPVFEAASVTRTRNEDAATVAFRAEAERRRKLEVQNSLARMKARIQAKKIDYTKVRWNPRVCKFEEIGPATKNTRAGATTGETRVAKSVRTVGSIPATGASFIDQIDTSAKIGHDATGIDWACVAKDTARRLAELNGVWDDKYAKLSGGLLVMTVTNRLKGLVKRGGAVKWT